MIDRHHLLECILWPNGDGTYRKIVNRSKRLKELGIYNDYKLTMLIEHRAHATMHREFEKGTEYERNNGMRGRTGDKHPMYGRKREKAPCWKGAEAGPHASYLRAKELYKAGKITEEEFQPYRDGWNEYKRHRKIAKKTSSPI